MITPALSEQLSKTAHALTGAHLQLAEERRKTLSARLENTRYKHEAEGAKLQAAKAWKNAWCTAPRPDRLLAPPPRVRVST